MSRFTDKLGCEITFCNPNWRHSGFLQLAAKIASGQLRRDTLVIDARFHPFVAKAAYKRRRSMLTRKPLQTWRAPWRTAKKPGTCCKDLESAGSEAALPKHPSPVPPWHSPSMTRQISPLAGRFADLIADRCARLGEALGSGALQGASQSGVGV